METQKPRKGKRRLFRRSQPGTAPGTVVADPSAHPTEIHVVAYNPDDLLEQKLESVDKIPEYLKKWPVTWINVNGLKDTEIISRLGEIFDLHKLALEDVVNVHQRAKVESYGENLFIVSRMLRIGASWPG